MNASLRLNHHSLVALVVAVGVLGCGGNATNKITVSGTVSYKGEPVTSGLLQFTGENNGYYGAANLLPDGSYTMTDVVPGEVKVSIMQTPGGSGSSSGEKSKPAPKPQAELPDKYRSPQTSGLKYPIKPDTTQLKIEIP
jgi:hypothetical protein